MSYKSSPSIDEQVRGHTRDTALVPLHVNDNIR
jgi:hypothetical protein